MMKGTVSRLCQLFMVCILLSCSGKSEGIRIAVPDDLCGLLAYHLFRDRPKTQVRFDEEVFPLVDCCNTTTEWALSADRIDAAWLCPDAARVLMEKDNRFEITGPALVNSYILLLRKGAAPRRIAYSHKRTYQRTMIRQRLGPDCEAIAVLPAALPYIYEKGRVDGIVIDVIKGLALKGEHLPLTRKGTDCVTYVLVVRKDFRRNREFLPFLEAVKDGAAALNDRTVLTKALAEYKGLSALQVLQIHTLGVRFIPPRLQ